MKCLCCDKILTDFESTRKHAVTGMFLDICQQCFKTVQADASLPTKDRQDLISADDMDDTLEDEEDSHFGDSEPSKDY